MAETPPRYQCVFCGHGLRNLDTLLTHEAKCEWRVEKQQMWSLLLRIAYERERTHGTK